MSQAGKVDDNAAQQFCKTLDFHAERENNVESKSSRVRHIMNNRGENGLQPDCDVCMLTDPQGGRCGTPAGHFQLGMWGIASRATAVIYASCENSLGLCCSLTGATCI